MKIVDLRIDNLGVHRELKLDVSNRKNQLIFLNGSNNHGKTSLLTALEFCLFDEDLVPDNLSKVAKSKMSKGDVETVRVSAKLLKENGDSAVVQREQKFTLEEDGSISMVGKSNLAITEIPLDWKESAASLPNPDEWLNQNFPQRFRDFVLFNGEKMSQFFDSRVKRAIEDAVREIANIDYFESLVEMLRGLRNDLTKKQAKLTGKSAEKLNEERQKLESALGVLRENLNGLKTSLDENRAIKADLEPLIESQKHGAEYLEQNKRLRIEEETAVSDINELQSALNQKLWSAGLDSFFVSRLTYPIAKQIEIADRAGQYPADFKPEAIRALIDSETCICGRSFHDEPTAKQALEDICARNLMAGPIGKELSDLKATLDRVTGQATASAADIERIKKELVKAKDRMRRAQLDSQKLAPKLVGLSKNEEQLAQIRQNFDTAERQIRALGQQIPMVQADIDSYESQIKKKQKEFDDSIRNSSEAQQLAVKVDFLERVLAQSEDFGERVLERVRLRLQDFVSKRFAETDGGRYETRITEDFQVETLSPDGTQARLSEGQKMVRAYLFSFALRHVIGLSLPLIVDTPIGRLDQKNTLFVAKTLTTIFGEGSSETQQAIFLMHDGEYTPYVMEHFQPLEPLEYYLEHFDDDALEVSTLKEGIDPEWFEYTAWSEYKKRRGGVN